MAISTDSLIDFFGTQDQVTVATPGAVADNTFSTTVNIVPWTNDDDAPAGAFVLAVRFNTLPTDGSFINLYARKMDVQGANDSPKPSAQNIDQYIGSFTVDGDIATGLTAYLVTNWLTLPNHQSSQIYEYYIENKAGQTIQTGWSLWVTPSTKGPHA